MQAMQQELHRQHDLLRQLVSSDLPALHMEIAFLRADLHALEERVSGDAPVYEADSRFVRSGIELPPSPAHHPPEAGRTWRRGRRKHPLGVCTESGSESEDSADASVEARGAGNTGFAVSLEPNVWDCSMMIALHGWRVGSDQFGRFNVFMAVALLGANIVIQFMFVFAVLSMADKNPYAEDPMLDNRLLQGQLFANMDHKSMTSRAQQTCNEQAYDTLGETVSGVLEYLKLHGAWFDLTGRTICLLAMVTWVVSIFSEVRRSGQDLISTVLSLPTTNGVESERHGDLLVITGAPWCHKLAAVCVLLPRLLIAFLLCWFGLRFQAATISLRDLLTNAVALEFIRSIDEMLFEAIMPRKLMGFVRIVKVKVFERCFPNDIVGGKLHLSAATRRRADGGEQPSEPEEGPRLAVQTGYVIFRIAAVVVVIVTAYVLYLEPVVEYTRDTYRILCGESTNFTYMVNPVTRVPAFASLDPYAEFSRKSDTQALHCLYAAQYEMVRLRAGFDPLYMRMNRTLQSLVNGSNSLCWQRDFSSRSAVACPQQNIGILNYLAIVSDTEFYGNPDVCRDQEVFLQVLRATCLNSTFFARAPEVLRFFRDVGGCSDLAAECRAATARSLILPWYWQIQKVCPETCNKCTFQIIPGTQHLNNHTPTSTQTPAALTAPPQPSPLLPVPLPLVPGAGSVPGSGLSS